MERKHAQQDLSRLAEIELVYKPLVPPGKLPQVKNSSDAHRLFFGTWNLDKIDLLEQFKVMLLNTNCGVLGICQLSSGGTTSAIVDIKLLFSLALKAGAQGMILAHNHPSGNLSPSDQDKALTKKIKQAARLLDISLQDHLIITSDDYYSFSDQGAL